MRILGARIFSKFFLSFLAGSARIFSKSFGGKIKHGQTDVNKEITFTKKNWHDIVKENVSCYLFI